jgi:hypothetical protein
LAATPPFAENSLRATACDNFLARRIRSRTLRRPRTKSISLGKKAHLARVERQSWRDTGKTRQTASPTLQEV